MKNTETCSKCNSREIIKIPGKAGAYGSGNNIQVGSTIFSAVKITRYLCFECGYSEEWIDSREDIEKLRNRFK